MSFTAPINLPSLDAPDAPHAPESITAAARPFPWVGLLALAAAVFLSVTSEMLPTGLLPDMSRALGVTEGQVGLLVSWFAFTVVLTSTSLAHLTRRLPRHGLIVLVLVVLAISNVLTAIAPNYAFMVGGRIIGGMAHGLFWAVVGAYAAHLVPREQIGRAVAITVSGGTLAFVFGVPIATAAGHLLGWRLSFLALAALMLIGAVVVWRFLPPVSHYGARVTDAAASDPTAAGTAGAAAAHAATAIAEPRRDPTMRAVILLSVITGLTMVGHYTFYTYIAPFLIDEMGVDSGAVAPLLFAYGIAGAVGLVLSGTVFGPRPQLGLVIGIAVSALSVTVLALFAATLPVAITAFVLWGLAFGMLPPLLQTRLLRTASLRIRDTASAIYTTAFNAGIGGGALLGAALLGSAGMQAVPLVYVGILALAFVLVIVSDVVVRRRAA
ncbi:MFS transporter [Cryobacterium sp. TMT2-18-3]|uniref:MFS transporter n=1 Tax=unclassified Cryobacterium TaxID=2649013 RepID=UPI00106B8320|nr:MULTISPECIES: MFS transporter [unclassified Cryobacterium]TFC26330.1 MFS transporter [Cryobacterium sp. TMT2-18-2]TFC64490.1 MFS transporter [Cryobacterium sp. TMT2-18-3]